MNTIENQEDNRSHIICIGKKIEIDTKKVKRYFKKGFKFAFSQIGLVCLVVGYVMLGAWVFMTIERDHEKENKGKILKNQEQFFEKIKFTAEKMLNGYLNEHFHMKYNIYRNQDVDYSNINTNYDFAIRRPTISSNSSSTKNNFKQISGKNVRASNEVIFDRNSLILKRKFEKPAWFVELDKDIFFNDLRTNLDTLIKENDKMEDKDKHNIDNEEVWTISNSLLYSATVITTIGNFFIFLRRKMSDSIRAD